MEVSASILEPLWASKSAALLAAPGVLKPTAFFACINILLFLIPLKAPKGGHRRLPHFGKAVEEGQNAKGMNPRQETVPRLPSGVAECGKQKQRKVGGLEAPNRAWRPQNRGWRLQNRGLEASKSSPGASKIQPRAFQDAILKRRLT